MWEFRRRPQDLESTAAQALETLFAALPELRGVYDLRWELTRIFEEAPDRATAATAIEDWRQRAEQSGLDWRPFLAMYDRHREGILAYFTERQTSGPVEGLNNKARVIVKRSYGLKSCDTLWTRLILDVNWAREKLGLTIERVRHAAHSIWRAFCGYYT